MKKKIILIGGGEHCKFCIDLIEAKNEYEIFGVIDVQEKIGLDVSGYKIFASDKETPALVKKYKNFLITIGQIKTAEKRKRLFDFIKNLGGNFPVIISPYAHIPKSTHIGEGTIVSHGVYLYPDSAIGNNCIVNTNAIIAHNVLIKDHCHISLGAVVTSDVYIEEGVFIGANSTVLSGVRIAKNTVIGAAAVVTHSIDRAGTYLGSPAKRMR
jgi:sugar O-acyltransferase (sialic acid O-acetyltransferase NeuD family)